MAQAIVDPAQLRQFAQTLKKFNEGLLEQSTALAGSGKQEVLRAIRTTHAAAGSICGVEQRSHSLSASQSRADRRVSSAAITSRLTRSPQ
jgi:hypothetical protein